MNKEMMGNIHYDVHSYLKNAKVIYGIKWMDLKVIKLSEKSKTARGFFYLSMECK